MAKRRTKSEAIALCPKLHFYTGDADEPYFTSTLSARVNMITVKALPEAGVARGELFTVKREKVGRRTAYVLYPSEECEICRRRKRIKVAEPTEIKGGDRIKIRGIEIKVKGKLVSESDLFET